MKSADMSKEMLGKLARELVMNIHNQKEIFNNFGIDENDYYEIQKNEYFQKVKEQLAIDWKAAVSSKNRLQVESQNYLEQLLPIVTRRAMREDTNLQTAIDHVKALTKISGMGGETANDRPNAERFVISINLGADIETYDKPIAIGAGEDNGKTDIESTKGAAEFLVRSAGKG